MSISGPELWQRIEREGLATSAECRQWAADVDQSLSADDAAHGLKILQRLVELKRLTNYQAKILAGQSTQPLHLGAWLVQQRVKDSVWSGWMVVRDQRAKTQTFANAPNLASGYDLWAFSLDAKRLAQLRDCSPSLSRALKLAAHRHESLQPTIQPEMAEGRLLALMVPITGELLSQKFAKGSCSPRQALKIVRQIASGLDSLHQSNIAHGRVLPDRIYWQSDRARLAVDPLCVSTTSIHEGSHGLLGQSLGALQSTQFMAPEFQAPAQLPTPATDVYSLGCVWWWLLTGKPLVSGESVTEAFQQHSQPIPRLPSGIELAEPLQHCLGHALGRKLCSRFSSAGAFLNAINAATNPAPIRLPLAERESKQGIANQSTQAQRQGSLGGEPIPISQPSVAGSRPTFERRRTGNPWLVPALAGCGFFVLLLAVLKFSGALQPGPSTANSDSQPGSAASNQLRPSTSSDADVARQSDPRDELFQIVNSGEGILWVPPSAPAPLPTDLLPPGGQFFLSFRPADLLDETRTGSRLVASFDRQLSPLLERLSTMTGRGLKEISQVTAVFHPPLTSGGMPQVCLRCELVAPRSLSDLKLGWQAQLSPEMVGDQTLLVNAQQLAYYVTPQPLVDSQSVSQFSVGGLGLMRDAAELAGAPGPLLLHLERLWNSSDRQADLSLFGSAPFLLTEGRGLLKDEPFLLSDQLKELLGGDLRGFGLQMRFDPQWYVETRFIGANDQAAGKMLAKNEQWLRSLPPAVESQLVSTTPHPYWRALALRFPQMLRSLVGHTRFGVENGTAIVNTYLPSEAASNILLAGWIALQPGTNLAVNVPAADSAARIEMTPIRIDDYLARPIRLSFDQEPIEVALSLVAEEANDGLPAGTPALRFELDGDAFEKAGITRNQQLRSFNVDGGAVRVALTEIAKRGNPVTTVTDTRQEDQKLIWVVKPDPEDARREMISLTTRTAAQAAGIALPVEFGN